MDKTNITFLDLSMFRKCDHDHQHRKIENDRTQYLLLIVKNYKKSTRKFMGTNFVMHIYEPVLKLLLLCWEILGTTSILDLGI